MSLLSNKKGSLSGLEFRVLSREISSALAGGYVANIYSIGDGQLFTIRRGHGEEAGDAHEASLVLSPTLGAWITERPARGETTEFTTALRSRLSRSRLVGVRQSDLDRVLVLDFEGKNEGRLELVLELLPPGNLVLVGADGAIALALRELRTGSRRVMKGRPYVPPSQTRSSLETVKREDLVKALAREKTLGSALGRGVSIPRRYVDEILARLSRRQEDPTGLSEPEVDEVMATVKGLLAELDKPSPCLVRSGGALEVMVARPTKAEVVESSPTLSPLLDRLFASDLLSGEEGRKAGEETEAGARARRVEELKATIAGLESKKAGLRERSEELRRAASSVGQEPDAERALAVVRKTLPPDLVASLERASHKGQASLSSAIFDRAKEAEGQIQDVETALEGLRAKVKREAGRAEPTRAKAVPLSRAKKEWYEKFRWFLTTGGKLAIGGRDAQSNSMLIRRHLEDEDTVYHADLFGSPFFVLKGGREQSEEEVREVARATVAFSSAWKTGLGAADAYWVDPDQVSSAGPSGEYLAHGSFAIKGKKNFVTKNPVEVAVGVDERGRVVSGPEESIMKVARGHVTLVPSREKPSDTAKKVAHELKAFLGAGAGPSVDEVLRMLPAGGGKIIRRRADSKAA